VAEISVTIDGLRDWQLQAWATLKRFNVWVVHRRAGKTVLAIIWLLSQVAPIKNGRGAYLAPLYNQAKRVAWDYLKRYAGLIPGTTFNEAELKATFANGSAIYLLGADNPHAIRGVGLNAAVLDEVAQMGPSVWRQVIRPALSDKKGAALFIGTPFGMANQFYELFRSAEALPDWARVYLTAPETETIDTDELVALQREMSPAEYAQEYLCDWNAAIKGAFWGPEMSQAEKDGRVTRVPHDPVLPVSTSWDLGMGDLTVVWYWQIAGAEIRAIRCEAFQGMGLPDIVRQMDTHKYRYEGHYLPHDAQVRELGTGRSRVEILQSLGVNPTVVPAQSLQDGIEAVRTMLPRCWFDRDNCGDGVEALKTYRTDWDDVHRVFKRTPLHSWESHYADAVRYFALGGLLAKPDRRPIRYRDKVVA
jgi:phage terminase large subunit